jgi:nucleoid-associated protein YejK
MPPSPELTALNCKLIPAAAEALTRSVTRTRLSKTDTVNRALQVYDYIEEQLRQGGELLIRKNGEIEKITII